VRTSVIKLEPEVLAKFEEARVSLKQLYTMLIGEKSIDDMLDQQADDRLEIAGEVIFLTRKLSILSKGILPSKEEADANTVLTRLITPLVFQATHKAHNETERARMEFRKARIDELESLVRLRHTMAGAGDNMAEIDIRIAAMKNVIFAEEPKAA
jgi:hypothetical protein